jgi:hypothetical protein
MRLVPFVVRFGKFLQIGTFLCIFETIAIFPNQNFHPETKPEKLAVSRAYLERYLTTWGNDLHPLRPAASNWVMLTLSFWDLRGGSSGARSLVQRRAS